MIRRTSIPLAFVVCAVLQAQAKADILGTAQTFAVLAGSAVTNTGPSVISGDLGVWPGTAISGFPPGLVTGGTIHVADAVAMQAQGDLTTAYNTLAGMAVTQDLTGQDLGGLTLTSGVYFFSTSAQLTGTLTLDTQGNPNSLFVFQIGSTLTTASNSVVATINGPDDCHIYWQIGSSATLGTGTLFQGNILALASITMNTGASILDGRALARNGAVTLDDIHVVAGCTCVLGPTSQDCNSNGIPDECDIANGTSHDCNLNGVPDECDLANGSSRDCNHNGVPDECDITSGTSHDCNLNGIPDECDLGAGTSQDCNQNGIPDECELPGALPHFTTCNETPTASVGVTLTFQVCASGGTPGNQVTLTDNGLPAGATLTPPLPLTGDTVCTTFVWTPTSDQAGAPVVVFFATDAHGCRAECKMRILVSQNLMLFGPAYGNGQFTMFGHHYDTQLSHVRRAFPVTMEHAPAPFYDALPSHYFVQVVMYNPQLFPQQPTRWSYAMEFIKDGAGQMHTDNHGNMNGIDIAVHTYTDADGHMRVSFPFHVQGM